MEKWDRVAWLCFHVPSFSKRRRQLADFNPLRARQRTASISAVTKQMDEMKTKLPDTLSPDALKQVLDKHRRKRNGKLKRD